jgi:hypothetical protein
MNKLASYLEAHIPSDTLRNMYERWGRSNLEALRNDDYEALLKDPKVHSDLQVANNLIHNRILSNELQHQPMTGGRDLEHLVGGLGMHALGAFGDIGTGIAKGMADLVNLPSNVVNSIVGRKLMETVPEPADISESRALPTSEALKDIAGFIPSAVAGAPAAKGLEALIGASRGLPAATRAGSALLDPTVGSSAYGASQDPQSPLSGALSGAALGAGAGLAGRAALAPVRGAAAGVAQSVAEPLINKLSRVLEPREGEIANAIGDAYSDADNRAGTQAWNTLSGMAHQADASIPMRTGAISPVSTFDSSSFQNAARNELGKLKPGTLVGQESGNDAKDLLSLWAKTPPSNFSEAVEANKIINSLPNRWDATNKTNVKYAQGLAGRLRPVLHDMIEKNAENNPVAQDMKDYWDRLRLDTARKAAFSELPTKAEGGVIRTKFSPSVAKMMGSTPNIDIEKHYLPSASKNETLNMEHLGNLLGSKGSAAQLIKRRYMQDAFKTGDFDPNVALKKYNNLGSAQKSWLFTPDERGVFDAANKSKQLSKGSVLAGLMRTKLLSRMPWSVIGGALVGHGIGGGALETLAGGTAGGLGGEAAAKALAEKAATPRGMRTLTALRGADVPLPATKTALAGLAPTILGNTGQ